MTPIETKIQEKLSQFDIQFKDKYTVMGVELEGMTKPLKDFFSQALREVYELGHTEGFNEGEASSEEWYTNKIDTAYERGVRQSAEIVNGWHINKGGYTELAHAIKTSLLGDKEKV